jgi:MFS family permease
MQLPIRDILLWTALPGALCVLLALSLRETPVAPVPASSVVRLPRTPLPAGYRRLLTAVGVFTLGQASQAFILLRATDSGMAPAQVALLWAAVAATSTLLLVPMSSWSDRVGRLPLMSAGWALYAATFVLLALAEAAWMFWGVALLVGLYQALTEGAERALIADQVPPSQLGTAYGAYYLVKGLLLLPASLGFGLLWQAGSAALAFGIGSACALAALALLWLWVRPALRDGA